MPIQKAVHMVKKNKKLLLFVPVQGGLMLTPIAWSIWGAHEDKSSTSACHLFTLWLTLCWHKCFRRFSSAVIFCIDSTVFFIVSSIFLTNHIFNFFFNWQTWIWSSFKFICPYLMLENSTLYWNWGGLCKMTKLLSICKQTEKSFFFLQEQAECKKKAESSYHNQYKICY